MFFNWLSKLILRVDKTPVTPPNFKVELELDKDDHKRPSRELYYVYVNGRPVGQIQQRECSAVLCLEDGYDDLRPLLEPYAVGVHEQKRAEEQRAREKTARRARARAAKARDLTNEVLGRK